MPLSEITARKLDDGRWEAFTGSRKVAGTYTNEATALRQAQTVEQAREYLTTYPKNGKS